MQEKDLKGPMGVGGLRVTGDFSRPNFRFQSYGPEATLEKAERAGWVGGRERDNECRKLEQKLGCFPAVTVKMASCTVPRVVPQGACCQTLSSAAPCLTAVSTGALKGFLFSAV